MCVGATPTNAHIAKHKDTTMEKILAAIKDKEGITVCPSGDTLCQVEAFVEEQLEEAMVGFKVISKVSIAVDELFTNIIDYSKATWAKITCLIEEEDVKVILQDNGIPYNPLLKEDPDISKPLEEREIGGLGIFMARKMADDLKYKYVDDMNNTIIIVSRNTKKSR